MEGILFTDQPQYVVVFLSLHDPSSIYINDCFNIALLITQTSRAYIYFNPSLFDFFYF